MLSARLIRLALLAAACFATAAASPAALAVVLPPRAATNGDQSVATGTTVVLDGTSSSDPQGLPLSYSWRLVGGPSSSLAQLFGADTAVASLTPDQPGAYFVELTVSNGSASNTAAVRILATGPTVLQRPKAIVRGPSQVALGQTVFLDGSSSTSPSGLTLVYSWRQTLGVPVSLLTPGASEVGFRSLVPGFVSLELTVTDGTSVSLPVTATVVILNVPPQVPVVDAGPGLVGSTGRPITLEGTLLAAGGPASVVLRWTYVGGPVANLALTDRHTTHPSFTPLVPGVYSFKMTADDGQHHAESSVEVTAVGPNLETAGAASAGGCGLPSGPPHAAPDMSLYLLLVALVLGARFAPKLLK